MSRRHWLWAASLVLAATIAAPPAFAQGYDAECRPVSAEEERTDVDIARAWGPIGLGLAIAKKACQGKEFLDRLLSKEPDLDQATLTDVFDATRPHVPEPISEQEHYRQEQAAAARIKARAEEARLTRLRSNAADEAVAEANEREAAARASGQTVQYSSIRDPAAPPAGPGVYTYTSLPPLNPNGFVTYFESTAAQADAAAPEAPGSIAEIDGEGTLIAPEGMKSGHFEDGELDGEGQEITLDGVWRGGYYQDGSIEGPGFEVFERDGAVYAIEAEFVNDRPEGYARVILSDGSSRIDLWGGGELLAIGAVAPRGQEPVPAVYQSPEQLAAEEAEQFEDSLSSAPNAAALYALADELAAQGDAARAGQAFRRILTRFPDSPFGLRASDRLADAAAQSAGAAAAPQGTPAAAGAMAATAAFNGQWIGQSSGNRATLDVRPNGVMVTPVTSNPGQSATGTLYVETGPGSYTYTLADGRTSVMVVQSRDTVRVTNTWDGWNDVFKLVPATPAQAPAPTVFDGEWRGDQSGNRVSLQLSSSGITVYPVTQNAGQSANGLLYLASGGGNYTYQFPNGQSSTIQVLSPDLVRVTNSDGWTDLFRLIGR
jgi:hypothetical protein